jgi:hypothetical protein
MKITTARSGDNITASVFLLEGPFPNDFDNSFQERERYPTRLIGAYNLGVGKTAVVALPENMRPLELCVVSQQPAEPTPLTIMNKTASLQATEIKETVGNHYTILLKNIGTKTIVETTFTEMIGKDRAGQTDGMNLTPGATKTLSWTSPTGRNIAGEHLKSTEVTISTVVFEDGAYEGDVEPAVLHEAIKELSKRHAILLAPILEKAIGKLDAEAPDAVVQYLHDAVDDFPSEVDPALQAAIRHYPELRLTPQFQRKLEINSKSQWKSLSESVFLDLKTNVMRNGTLDQNLFKGWLRFEKERCQQLANH